MAKDREVVCVYYEFEGSCLKGHDGTFRDACQKCKYYISKRGGMPARTDNRKKKMEKINKREMRGDWQ